MKPTLAQRGREFDVVAELAEQFDARAELDPGRLEIARSLLERAEQPSGPTLVAAILGDQCRGQGRFGVVPRRGRHPPFGVGLGTQEQELAGDERIGRHQIEGSRRVTLRLVDRTDIERPLRRPEQQPNRLIARCSPAPRAPDRSRRRVRRPWPRGGRPDRSASSRCGPSPMPCPRGVAPAPASSASGRRPRAPRRCGTARFRRTRPRSRRGIRRRRARRCRPDRVPDRVRSRSAAAT